MSLIVSVADSIPELILFAFSLNLYIILPME